MAEWFIERVIWTLELFDIFKSCYPSDFESCAQYSPPLHIENITEIEEVETRITEHIAAYIKRVEECGREAVTMMRANNKSGVLRVLNLRKIYETSIANLVQQRDKLILLKDEISNAAFNVVIASALEMGNRALETINSTYSLVDIDNTIDQISEQVEKANLINHALSSKSVVDLLDEDELEKELALLANTPSSALVIKLLPACVNDPLPLRKDNDIAIIV